ncbi:YbfB/YjiJ family MFS transporter [Shewanella sp. SR44-3]|uniref:YbfB/YjiJ family MFS transporter n=1 Tax=Shewanella sp. SR44-3 TaxID=2760936 RepID=UPI0015FE3378|nr:YbfB/YjiJ family MFS transporter [Shewanella sp. SR44-3]MBB1268573.1 YbfB/YjiJ family MFS transporter [Shewanella sp. SR44-3]
MPNNPLLNRYSLAGLAATLIGNGIGRFAYIALMPALIQAGWFSQSDASYLGVATLIGYIFGAPAANLLIKYFTVGQLIRTSMLVSSFSYLGCAFEGAPILWFYVLRTLAGVAGAMLMVLAPPAIMRMHDSKIKARISGVIFSGIGLGAMLSGTLIPLLIYHSLVSAWLGMGFVALGATLLTWNAWSAVDTWLINQNLSQTKGAASSFKDLSKPQAMTLALILSAYTFNAIGYLPHTLFWVDYIVRELEMSLLSGGLYWATFGIGAAIGPILTGMLGDRLGSKRSLLIAFTLKALGVSLPLLSTEPISLFMSSLLVGIFTPGTVTLVSTYTLESVGYGLHTKAWSMMTLSFAISQGVVGYAMAFYATTLTSYTLLFGISACALFLSVLCIAFTSHKHAEMTVIQPIS